MDFDLLWLILAVLVGAYAFLFGFLKKINEWYYVSWLGKRQNSLPPGDMGWPFIGNMLSFLRAFNSEDPDSFIKSLVDRYGETGIYKASLFLYPSIIVCNPELCRKVLTDDEQFLPGYPSSTIKIFGKKSLQSVTDSEHKLLRRLITAPINGHKTLPVYIEYIEDIVISSLQEWSNKESPIELLTELKIFSLKVFVKIFIDTTNFLSESTINNFTDMFQGLAALNINFPGFAFHKALKARKVLVDHFQAEVKQRRTRKIDETKTKKGMIDQLLEVEDDEGEKLGDEDVIDLLIGFLLAGHETTAVFAMWLTIYLNDHPEILQKCKEEQVEILKRRPSSQKGLTLNEIRQMEYLSKVIDETLRKSSIVFSIFRKAKVDVEINGYFIPKGWRVLVWNRDVHLNSEIYSNPKEFLPSRWDNHTPKVGSFIPFGAGSRTCAGADLAKFQISILFHYFLLNYSFEQINPRSPIKYLTSPSPMDNCLAKITKLP